MSNQIHKSEFLDHMENMLKRPRMFAQNAASFEDQMLLLYEHTVGFSITNRNRYFQFCKSKTGSSSLTLASFVETIDEIAPILKEFYEPEISSLKKEYPI
jgi:hypothetical protein